MNMCYVRLILRVKATGVTLNRGKCKFGVTELLFSGHIINGNGIRPDLEKVPAIDEMAPIFFLLCVVMLLSPVLPRQTN